MTPERFAEIEQMTERLEQMQAAFDSCKSYLGEQVARETMPFLRDFDRAFLELVAALKPIQEMIADGSIIFTPRIPEGGL